MATGNGSNGEASRRQLSPDVPISGHLRAVFEGAPFGLLVADRAGLLVLVNGRAASLFGYEPNELIGQSVDVLLPERLAARHREERAAYSRAPSPRPMGEGRDLVGRRKDGTEFPVEVGLSPMRVGDEMFVIAAMIDLSRRKAAEEGLAKTARELEQANARLQLMATHDPLTCLLNRRGLDERLRLEIGRTHRNGSSLVAIFIDCDDFKAVNDTLGHPGGDALLTAIAETLRGVVRPSDAVARVGGDEFLILLPGTRLAEGVYVAEKVRRAVNALPFPASLSQVTATVSLGVAEVSHDAKGLDDVLRLTDDALRRSKALGKNCSTGGLLGELAGVSVGSLTDGAAVSSQSILRLADETQVGCELAARLPGQVDIASVFGVTIDMERITAIDLECLRVAAEWARRVGDGMRVHLNVLPATVSRAGGNDVISAFGAALSERRFCVELSERQFVGDPASLLPAIRTLKAVGVDIALDDVGFGRSSLEALLVLEPALVKVDPRYVFGIAANGGKRRELERLLNVTRVLHASMVAVGVENGEDLATLRRMGVEMGQGSYWGPPSPLTS